MRIIKTCKAMGIKTVALCPVKGEEHDFLETSLADELYYLERVGSLGYLDGSRILEIARESGVDAIHPGYGFLAENWEFAEQCKKNNIKFIGPHFETLRILADKIEAKKIAEKIGIPTISSSGLIENEDNLLEWAGRITTPFILKASRGGGGIGMRVVDKEIKKDELINLSQEIRRETTRAFGNDDFFIEKYFSNVRHIEFQILGDGKNVIHLGERDCSIQRRFQKLLEEAPSFFCDEALRSKIGEQAVEIGKELCYEGAGTVEFLVDENKNYYFIEINPRLQVEHPVTEAITGIDIVEQQICIAEGMPLAFEQDDIRLSGWAIEARINAEDVQRNFQPSSGMVVRYKAPIGEGIMAHSFLHDGQEIYPYFDSLLAKIVAVGKNREEAIEKLRKAMDEIVIEGVVTTTPFFKKLFAKDGFLRGAFSTDFVSEILKIELMNDDLVNKSVGEKKIKAPLAGMISEIFVKKGDVVVPGQKLLTLSAMKMENEVIAERYGIVQDVSIFLNQRVKGGEILIILT